MSAGTPRPTDDQPDAPTGAAGEAAAAGQHAAEEAAPAEEAGIRDRAGRGGDRAAGGPQTGRGRRAWPGVVARALVVVVVAGVGYQVVVPTTTTVRSRLARLVVSDNGTKAFPGAPSHAAEEPATTGGLAPLQRAAKAHPNQTGLYVEQWTSKAAPGAGLVVAAFLLPDVATADAARAQLVASQLSPSALASSGFRRSLQFSPPGVAGGAGALYVPARGGASPGEAALAVGQRGRVVALVEVALAGGSPQGEATTAAQLEDAHLRAVEPGFTLSVTRHPTTATALWVAGSLVLLVLVAAGPVFWERRRRRLERRHQDELARTIRVGGSTIVRKRHGE